MSTDKAKENDHSEEAIKTSQKKLLDGLIETEGDYNQAFGTKESDPDNVATNLNIGLEPRLNSANVSHESAEEFIRDSFWSEFRRTR